MEFFADWHTHSKYSDGRCTIEDIVQAAKNRGLEQVAITDHGPRNIGVGVRCPETYLEIKNEVKDINHRFEGIQVMTGAEADIISKEGEIDIPKSIANQLDILIVGMHPLVWPSSLAGVWNLVGINQLARVSRGAREKARVTNTKALKEAVYTFNVDFVSHPDLKMPLDIEELTEACTKAGTALEINTGHHYQKEDLVETALKSGVNFVVNSDAHFSETVGDLESGSVLLENYGVPPERVLNAKAH